MHARQLLYSIFCKPTSRSTVLSHIEKEKPKSNRKVSSMPRMSHASKSASISNASKSSSGSELKQPEIIYALVSGPGKVQIVNQMDKLTSDQEIKECYFKRK
jgi:hypothetical protein